MGAGPELAKQTNVEATSRLLDAASAAGVRRFVLLSTCQQPDATVVPITGEDPRHYRVGFEKIRSVSRFEAAYSVPQGIDEVAALVQSGQISDPTDLRRAN